MTDGRQLTEVETKKDNGANPFQEVQLAQLPPGYQQGDPQYGKDPNANGTGGVPTWRRSFNDPGLIAPGVQGQPEVRPVIPAPAPVVVGGDNGNGVNPFAPGPGGNAPFVPPAAPAAVPEVANPVVTTGAAPTVENVPSWIQSIQPNDGMVVGPGSVPSANGRGVRFGNSFVPYGADGELLDIYGKARQPVENSLLRMTKLNDLLTTGLYVGGASGLGWHAADDIIQRLPEAVRGGNPYTQYFSDHLSPLARKWAPEASAATMTKDAFAAAAVNEASALTAVTTATTAVDDIIAATRTNPLRGAAVADLQQTFVNSGNFSKPAIDALSILESSEIATAKAYVQAAEQATARSTELGVAEQVLARATSTRDTLRNAIPSSVHSNAEKAAWFNGHTPEKMTDSALSRARAAGGGKLFDSVEIAAIKQFRDAAAEQALATATRDTAVKATVSATAARDAASQTLETMVAGSPKAAEKLSFIKTPGMTVEAIEKAATFTQAEAAALATLGEAVDAKALATKTASGLSTEASAAEAALLNARNTALNTGFLSRAKGYGLAIGEGAGIGLATVGINIGADYLLSTALGEKPRLTGTSAWGLEAIAVPFILFNPKIGVGKKLAFTAAAYTGSHIFGSLLGEPSGRFSELGRPSWTEVGLSTAGAMIPFKDWRMRAGAAVVGWGLGKAWAISGFEGKEPKAERDEAVAALNVAITGRDETSFRTAVQETRDIAKQNDGAVELIRWDWFRKQSGATKDHPMVAWRGDAILAAGQGLGRIDQGSRLLDGKNHDPAQRYFPDTYLDLGGEGTQSLRSAAGTLMMMEDYAKKNPTETIGGKPIAGEAEQAAKLRVQVEEELNKVYGQQDVNGTVDHLKYMYREGGGQALIGAFAVKLEAKVNATPDGDPRYKAKLARDLAMVALALSELKAENKDGSAGRDGSTAAITFSTAEQAMRLAVKLDPQNVNNKNILSVLERVRQKVPGAINNQFNSPATNPFGIEGPNGQRPK